MERRFILQTPESPWSGWTPPYFYQIYWDIIRNSVISLCTKSFKNGTIPSEINETHICLIPETKNANKLKDFRHISLCNTIYKIITKIISHRLRPLMNKMIGPYQASFFKNRQATDNAIIAQEVFTHFQKMKGKAANMILKLDLEKRFDKMEWSFIWDTLHYFKLLQSIINLMSCITTCQTAILVNVLGLNTSPL